MNKFRIPLAFLCVLVIWTTTPLAVQWSSVSAPLMSVLIRMLIGIIFCLAVISLMQIKLPFDAASRRVYAITGLSLFASMSLIYIAAQSVPSGWISVIFGLSPIFTGVFSIFIEPDAKLTYLRIFGMLLGFTGLVLVFQAGLAFDSNTLPGIGILLASVLISSISSIFIRHFSKDSTLQPMQMTIGGLIMAIPCFALSAFLLEPNTAINFSNRELISIFYLGLIGTGIGFTMYYFLLKNLPASKVALIMLITPISSLLIGNLVNNEPVIQEVWIGAFCVSIGLMLYEYRPKFGLRRL